MTRAITRYATSVIIDAGHSKLRGVRRRRRRSRRKRRKRRKRRRKWRKRSRKRRSSSRWRRKKRTERWRKSRIRSRSKKRKSSKISFSKKPSLAIFFKHFRCDCGYHFNWDSAACPALRVLL